MTDKEKQAIERVKLCSNNECNICGRYEKEECMLERNRCEKTVLNLIEKQQAEIEDWGEEYNHWAHKAVTRAIELEKKDKIIDEMAEQLTTPIHSKEWVIEYYTKKIETEEK